MLAYLFPGQGAQYVGMGKDLYERFLPARRIFDKADEVLGFSLSGLCFDGPAEDLTQTWNCQPAILTVSIAAWEAFRSRESQRVKVDTGYAAGLSLGEYSALVASGMISFEGALLLVKRRAEFMTEASQRYPGKMLAVIGLDSDTTDNLCRQTDIEIANRNCPGQIVVTGRKECIDGFSALAQEKGAKQVIELDVSGAFHSSLMEDAGLKLKQELEKVEFMIPQDFRGGEIRVISNVSARPFVSIEEIRENLALQVSSPVLWEDSMRYIMSQGVRVFLEVGPGKVLKGLLRKIDPSLEVINLEKPEDIISCKLEKFYPRRHQDTKVTKIKIAL